MKKIVMLLLVMLCMTLVSEAKAQCYGPYYSPYGYSSGPNPAAILGIIGGAATMAAGIVTMSQPTYYAPPPVVVPMPVPVPRGPYWGPRPYGPRPWGPRPWGPGPWGPRPWGPRW